MNIEKEHSPLPWGAKAPSLVVLDAYGNVVTDCDVETFESERMANAELIDLSCKNRDFTPAALSTSGCAKSKFLSVALLAALPVLAGDYFVSTTGTDAPSRGTAALPWKTINYAITGRLPGDTVHVTAGQTFTENVYFGSGGGSGGSPGNPVTLCLLYTSPSPRD